MSGTLIDYYSVINQNTAVATYLDHTERIGQAITLVANADISSAKFYCKKEGSPTGNIYAFLFACSGTVGSTGQPTGSPLATSDAIDVSTLTTSYQLIEFTFSPAYSASAGDIVVMVGYDSGDSGNNLRTGLDNSSPTHAGNYCFITGGTPGRYSTYDACFYLYKSAGWTGKVLAVNNPAKVLGVLSANIKKIIGV